LAGWIAALVMDRNDRSQSRVGGKVNGEVREEAATLACDERTTQGG
jgi:hypothetical protein